MLKPIQLIYSMSKTFSTRTEEKRWTYGEHVNFLIFQRRGQKIPLMRYRHIKSYNCK